ncbi:MAG: PEGA domain-containing protein [Defluviitaleaceae bacterium]|nr:PEGA domain-containing protein [Defluviitaleaceae bacterium]
MSDDKFNKDDFYDDNYNYDDYSDNYKYDSYDDDYSLTRDDDTPLTSAETQETPLYERPLSTAHDNDTKRIKQPTRQETIRQIAEEQQRGNPRKPGIMSPDQRLAANPYAGRRLSGTALPHPTTRSTRTPRASASSRNTARRPRPRKQKKSQFAAFYIILLLIAVGVCLTVLLVMLDNANELIGNNPIFGTAPLPSPTPSPAEIPRRVELHSQTAIITDINPLGEYRLLTMLDISTRRSQEFAVTDETRFFDRLNRALTFAELRVGNMFDIRYDSNLFTLDTVSESRLAWERRSRTNVKVDIENSTITLGNDTWSFIPGLSLVLHRGEPYPISQVRTIDSVTLIGQGDTVWLVQVDAAHGYLQLTNTELIANGSVVLGTNLVFALDDISESIELPEGTHRIIIDGDNIETFIEDVVIEAAQTTELDMSEAQLRAALLHVVTTPEDAQIFINGELLENTITAQVEFGEVRVRVEQHGFVPQEQVFDVIGPINTVTFDLVEITTEHTLSILTTPTNAEIYINNEFIGHSSLTHKVPPGTYSIEARLAGYESAAISVPVTANDTEDIWKYIMLTPTVNDPFANIQQPEVEPLPSITPTPIPTLPPAVPFPTLPPDSSALPPQNGIIPLPSPTPYMPLPSPTPYIPLPVQDPTNPPLINLDDENWWVIPPPQ